MFATIPQSLKSEEELANRRSMLETAPHIQSLEEWRVEYASTRSVTIPNFDPADAGDQARVLWLLDQPPATVVAPDGTGIVSVDNPDNAAERCWHERNEAGLHDGVLMWNMIPYCVEGKATASDKMAGIKALGPVLRLLPRLEVVILSSADVQQAWKTSHLGGRVPRATVLDAPGVGRQAMSRNAMQSKLTNAVQRAKRIVG